MLVVCMTAWLTLEIQNLIFRQNTLNTGGNSVGVKGGSNGLFELNVTNQGLMQHDGAAIQVDYDRTNGTIMQKLDP